MAYHPPQSGGQFMGLATLIGVMAVLMVSYGNWRDIDRIEDSLDDRLQKIETQITQVATKVDNLPAPSAPAQPARSGPDPNKAYPIKIAGSPSKGPANAPIVIAEFSDFQ